MLKSPQIGSSSRARPMEKLPLHLGPSVKRVEKNPEIRGNFSGAVEAFVRGNGSNSGLPGDHLRQRTLEDVPSSKVVHIDFERGHVSRTGNTSKRSVVSHTRPSSLGEPSDNCNGRLGSRGDSLSTMQRLLPGFESKSSTLIRPHPTRVVRDGTFRSFDMLTIGSGKKK